MYQLKFCAGYCGKYIQTNVVEVSISIRHLLEYVFLSLSLAPFLLRKHHDLSDIIFVRVYDLLSREKELFLKTRAPLEKK